MNVKGYTHTKRVPDSQLTEEVIGLKTYHENLQPSTNWYRPPVQDGKLH